MRLDAYLSERSLVRSRERAKTMIKAGCVKIDGKVCTKPSAEVSDANIIEIDDSDFNYVGRGLLKLAAAFGTFDIDITDKVCADIGASTGGFTQCMLEHGARLVYAVDVGHDQLDEQLKNDSRVVNMEGVNAKNLTPSDISVLPEFISVDLSFISLKQVMPVLKGILSPEGTMAVLIKPQFEAGKSALNKKGIVRDKKDHVRVLNELIAFFVSCGLSVRGVIPSGIRGGDGNVEYLAYLCIENSAPNVPIDVKKLVDTAFDTSGNVFDK